MQLTTLKKFKRSYWADPFSHRLYEGRYYPLRPRETKVSLRRNKPYIHLVLPAWSVRGIYISLTQFPKSIRKAILQWSHLSRKSIPARRLEKQIISNIQRYFVQKINITKKQAKVLIALQTQEDISLKKLHRIHKQIGA